MQHAAFIIKSANNSIDGEKKKENYCSVKKKQEEEGEREGGAPLRSSDGRRRVGGCFGQRRQPMAAGDQPPLAGQGRPRRVRAPT